jgi:hypothetical protein
MAKPCLNSNPGYKPREYGKYQEVTPKPKLGDPISGRGRKQL